MNSTIDPDANNQDAVGQNTTLDQLLNRSDIWRGDSYRPTAHEIQNTGYAELNIALLNGGWPKGSLVEVCQKGLQWQEWLLFLPALSKVTGYVVLLNPPAIPFGQAFIQAGIDLERILVVQITNKADFLASFSELARTHNCEALLAWQQHYPFSYTELRKCLLATNEGTGLCVLFRPENTQQQSSPAVLRLHSQLTATHVQLNIFKQKGVLQAPLHAINLPLPEWMKGFLPYALLDQTNQRSVDVNKRKSATIVPLRRRKK